MDAPISQPPPTRDPGAQDRLGQELAIEFARRWQAGDRPRAEDLLAAHPQLSQTPEAAVELIYEEYCAREAAGESGVEQDILRRFPRWAGPLRVMLECHRRVIDPQDRQPLFPAVGQRLAGFRMTELLATGAHGRVYLASQPALADRPVVLKVTPLRGGEHVTLARLQHTNIVPLYSAFDDPATRTRALVMPYFGRATLAAILRELDPVPLPRRTGRHLFDAVARLNRSPSPVESRSRLRSIPRLLDGDSFANALAWLAACLADALHHAHERGLVHLDVKPSNVLLADDGQPMLLDFHLARAPIHPDARAADDVGGTPAYMPPEQRSAMHRLRDALPVEHAVDARADVYSIGALLYDALGGRLPVESSSPPLAGLNPQVTPGLSDIVVRCLAPQPDDRYPTAGELADDLRRHLSSRPLAGVPNRSLAERWSKWRRRRPAALRGAAMLLLSFAAAAMLTAGAALNFRDSRRQAELALQEGRRHLESRQFADAARNFDRGLALSASVPFNRELSQQLQASLDYARRLALRQELRDLADATRLVYPADNLSPDRLRTLSAACTTLLQKRDTLLNASAADPDLAADLQDIAMFTAIQFRTSHAPATTSPANHPAPPAGARERTALGRACLASGDLPRAARELAAALEQDPAGCWPNFYYGLCAYRMNRFDDAVNSFSVCIGGHPEVAAYFYNRALAYSASGRRELALRDYDRALQIDPINPSAALNRGMLQYELGRLDAAADLQRALLHGADASSVHYDLALVRSAAGDHSAARRELDQALRLNPDNQQARRLQVLLQNPARPPDPRKT